MEREFLVGLGFGDEHRVRLVNALAVSGTNLYAGGYFTTAGGVAATNIAQWNGSSWSALGSGMRSLRLMTLAVSGTNLYAGGYFTTAGGVAANYIAQWNGSSWSALGSGMNSACVYALAVSGTNLYAGGDFTTAGGVSANHIAQWNGSSWSALGSGMRRPQVACAGGVGHQLVCGRLFRHGGRGGGQLHCPMEREFLVGFGPTDPRSVGKAGRQFVDTLWYRWGRRSSRRVPPRGKGSCSPTFPP